MTSQKSEAPASPPQHGILRRLTRGAATLTLTAIFIAAAGGMVWQGTTVISDRAQAVEPPTATAPVFVSTMPIEMRDHYMVKRAFTGQVEAPQTAALAFEQGGTIRMIAANEGDTVVADQVLAALDDRLLRAERRRLVSSKAALDAQRQLLALNNERASELNQRGFASTQTVDQTRLGLVELDARMAETDAAIAAIDVQLDNLEIKAPFDGTINVRHVDPGTAIGAGLPVVTLVEDSAPVFRVGVDPNLGTALKVGDDTTVYIDDIGVPATVIGILPQIDPTTRTRTVRARLDEAANGLFGMAGDLRLDQRIEAQGAWLPLSALEDGVRGLWTIKTVPATEDPAVQIEAVELVYANDERAFVRGTFQPDAMIIFEGVHRVVGGQTVRIKE
ncbi:MAG: efflux RND transporter periplasmic adaptor subunit [Pseudomonadota bacterium]